MKKLIEKFFGKKENANKVSSKTYLGRRPRSLQFEPLESREMLAISWGVFNDIEKIIAPLKDDDYYASIFDTAILPFIGDNLGSSNVGKQAISGAIGNIESAVENLTFANANEFKTKLESGLNASVTQLALNDSGSGDQGSARFEISIPQISAETFGIDVAANFGLPGLGMEIDRGSQLSIQFFVDINFIIGYDNGTIYLDTSKDKEITLTGTLKGNNVTVVGTMGVLEVDINLGNRNLMEVKYAIDIPTQRITSSNTVKLTATADLAITNGNNGVTVGLSAQFTRSPDTYGVFNPNIEAELVFAQWNNTTSNIQNFNSTNVLDGNFGVELKDIPKPFHNSGQFV